MPSSFSTFSNIYKKKREKKKEKNIGVMPCTFFCTLYCKLSSIIFGIIVVTHEQVEVWAYCGSLVDEGV